MLQTKDLSISIGHKKLIDHASVKIIPGTVTALLGSNGSGKTTLLTALAGNQHKSLKWIQTGECLLDDRPIQQFKGIDLARRRAVVTQHTDRTFAYTVREYVSLGYLPTNRQNSFAFLRNKNSSARLDDQRIDNALQIVDMEKLAIDSILDLSGGEFARIKFAQALVQIWPNEFDAKNDSVLSVSDDLKTDMTDNINQGNDKETTARYLLLDEPVAALDINHQHRLLATLSLLAMQWQIGILITIHDINLAIRYANQLVWLKNGSIVSSGSLEETLSASLIQYVFDCPVKLVENEGQTIVVYQNSDQPGINSSA